MQLKTLSSKLLFGAVFLLIVAGSYFLLLPQLQHNTPVNTASDALFGWKFPEDKFPFVEAPRNLRSFSDFRDPKATPQGLPVRLKIPSLGVNAAIEDALITRDGRMDVPLGSVNVAWFSLGPAPGQVGSAVIGGHFGISNGVPFVFYNLNKLQSGDKIYIIDDKSATLAFVVRSIQLFHRTDDATTVFTSDDGLAHLNLITCEGVWNRVNDSYPERRVVFTDALPAENGAAVGMPEKSPNTAFLRSLEIGTQGADVAALQSILVQKGFLRMPSGVSYGYFGALTRAAVIEYQTSVALPANGIFDALTRTELVSEQE